MIRHKAEITTPMALIQHSTEIPNKYNQTRKKKKKDIQIGREEVKLFVSDMILHIEYPKDSTKKVLQINLIKVQDRN